MSTLDAPLAVPAGSRMSWVSETRREWLEVDGLGGFASGTASGIRTRRYHALLLVATTPPTGRYVLVNGLEAWLETPAGTFSLTSQHYAPDVVHPDGVSRIQQFSAEPWPQWTFALTDGTRIEHGIFVQPGRASTALYWRLLEGRGGTLAVRPLISGRDYHSLHYENPAFNFEAEMGSGRVIFNPYKGVPAIVVHSSGIYSHQPEWYRNFLYSEERERGLDCVEDLASPGLFRWELGKGEATMRLSAGGHDSSDEFAEGRVLENQRRRAFPTRLHRAAYAYIASRGKGKTIIAGFPWFTDWGRDTFISLRGLCIATGRLEDARSILLEWPDAVSEGMLPNRFPDSGQTPEYNAVDASLWYVVAVHDFVHAVKDISLSDRRKLEIAVEAILRGYAHGTRFGIGADADGLLKAEAPGVQLTWMDAKVGDWVVTPRGGKPVEVQALWLNALKIGAQVNERWESLYAQARESFLSRFWDESRGCLYDVVDCDHRAGEIDRSLRPNQILPSADFRSRYWKASAPVASWILSSMLCLPRSACVRWLQKSLATHPVIRVARERDGSYHQGTVWPWLMGAFVEAWLRVRGNAREAKQQARATFLASLLSHLDEAGIGHLPEIADGDTPHTPRGCLFQAWSVCEALRLQTLLDQ